MKVRFNLRNKKADTSLIFLIFRYSGNKFVYSTRQTIPVQYWDDNKQRAKRTRRFPEYLELNNFLDKLASETKTIYRRLVVDQIQVTSDKLKTHLDSISLSYEKPHDDLISFADNLVTERIESKKLKYGTVKVQRTALNHLKKYLNYKKKKYLHFDEIDLEFFHDFTEYLFQEKRLSTNYVQKMIEQVKLFMQISFEREIHSNLKFKSRRFSLKKDQVDTIYLSEQELNQIYFLDLRKKPNLDKTKDLFLIGAFTGLRYSDFSQLQKQNYISNSDGNDFIKIRTVKTNQAVTIPVHPIVKSIFLKYKHNVPRAYVNQVTNRYLKEIARLAKIDDEIIISKNRAGSRYDIKKIKWQLVTSHVARRSFATNAYKAGLPSLAIMKITGHKTEREFMKYIKVSNEENAVLLSQSRFFSGKVRSI